MKTHAVLALSIVAAVALAACGGSNPAASTGATGAPPVAVATPTPTPAPTQPAPCQLAAPTVDCAVRKYQKQELAAPLQTAIDTAVGTPGVMYSDNPSRIYDLALFRSKVVGSLSAQGICGAWDYGNEIGDEIYTRSADGCEIEQYDVITGGGGVRNANRQTNLWSDGWGVPVPSLKPDFPKDGDLSCSLPGDRSTFCFTIKGTRGEFGQDVFALMNQVLNEHPELVDKGDFLPGQGEAVPDSLRPAAWRITNLDGYIAALEQKIRANGYCGFVDKGDILKVKKVSTGNIFHEEIDVIQNPASGGSYTGFVVKDRCHDAGF